MSKLAPFYLCSSKVAPPPENAYLFILFFTSFGLSFKRIELVGIDDDILLFKPYKAGKNEA